MDITRSLSYQNSDLTISPTSSFGYDTIQTKKDDNALRLRKEENSSFLLSQRNHSSLCSRRRLLSTMAVLMALVLGLGINYYFEEEKLGGSQYQSTTDPVFIRHASPSRDTGDDHLEPNPPVWPDSIRIFYPGDEDIVETISNLTSNLTNLMTGHFSTERYAFLFHPGQYASLKKNFEVGFYVQILGLGRNASDVQFVNNGPQCSAMDRRVPGAGSLDSFWRSIENIRISYGDEKPFVWAVSQASPLRRIRIDDNLELFEGYCIEDENGGHPKCGAYYASGGFMANIQVNGYTNFGSQQQFLSRNCDFNGGSGGGAWNLVFLGCEGREPLEQKNHLDGPDLVRTDDPNPRIRAEKPYIVVEQNEAAEDKYKLVVPKSSARRPQNNDRLTGSTLTTTDEDNDIRDFSNVRLARPTDSYQSIQLALDEGLDVVFSPGIYNLGRTLRVNKPGTVILGLGMTTLIAPHDGSPIIHVAPLISDVRIAGLILEATILKTPQNHYVDSYGIKYPRSTLLIWGSPGIEDPGAPNRPGVLSDIFCRIGGSTTTLESRNASVEVMIQLYSGNIVGDHLWLWRPDHLGPPISGNEQEKLEHQPPSDPVNESVINPEHYIVQNGECQSKTGLQVIGDDVTLYGLSAEHFTGDMIVWRGERGSVRFYQSELPYDVTQQDYGNRGYVSYLVDEYVRSHDLIGGGVYSFFRDDNVSVPMAFRHPGSSGNVGNQTNHSITMTNIFTRFLNGCGSIHSVVNMKGDSITTSHRLSRVPFSH